MQLESKGFTYFTNGNVYFDISKVSAYTKLSKVDLETLKTAARDDVEEDQHKKNPQDFVLWFTKSKFENQAMKWDSPWGTGYPGWHIECSVIALKYLGETLDIHCGGVDHIPVHHTNEIAQMESYTGKAWTKYWWHTEFLIDTSGKMSKSAGEFLTVSLLEKKNFQPLAYRYYVLNSHYRKQLIFSFENLQQAEHAYNKLKQKTIALKADLSVEAPYSEEAKSYLEAFNGALADDLNTANAITVVYNVLKSQLSSTEKANLIAQMDEVLSLNLLIEAEQSKGGEQDETWIIEAIEKRSAAKASKDWALADEIRNNLKAKGIVIKDTAQGTEWSYEL